LSKGLPFLFSFLPKPWDFLDLETDKKFLLIPFTFYKRTWYIIATDGAVILRVSIVIDDLNFCNFLLLRTVFI